MASYSVKSVLFLIIVVPCVCSALPSFRGTIPFFEKPISEVNPALNSLGKLANEQYPSPNSNEIALHKFALEQAIKKGEGLAIQYFGPGGKKGFRWGAKQYTRYRSVADKCEKFEQTLTSCTPVQKNHAPGCVLHCVVEITKNIHGNTHSCSKYEDCDYPEDAVCNLDQPDYLSPNCANL